MLNKNQIEVKFDIPTNLGKNTFFLDMTSPDHTIRIAIIDNFDDAANLTFQDEEIISLLSALESITALIKTRFDGV